MRCNLCYLSEFLCDYENSYYKITGNNKRENFTYLLFDKIPQITLSSKESYKTSNYPATLGGVIRWIKDEITRQCNEYKIRKRIKKAYKGEKSLCCEKLDFTVKENGCNKPYTKKKKKYLKPRYFERKFRKSTRKFFKKRYKGKFFKRNPKKICPKGKGKNCICWICNEGHYANECSIREQRNSKHYNKVKMLTEFQENGFYPI